MSFCPKCKSEYINGRPTCADCGTLLVESLDEIMDEKESFEPENENIEDELFNDEISNEDENISNDFSNTDDDKDSEKPQRISTFVSQKDRYKDYISTGYIFLIVSIIGLTALTLNVFGIINIFSDGATVSAMFYIVMYAMFLIFLFVSINAFKNSKTIKEQSVKEDNFLNELNAFIKDEITIDKFSDCNEEELEADIYFQRTEIIKHIILEKYPEVDPFYLENVVDETYDSLFTK